MDKKASINSYATLLATVSLLSACSTNAPTPKPVPLAVDDPIPATTIKYASGDVLTWKEGQYVDISRQISPQRRAAKRVKMSKHLGVIEGVAKGPTVLNTQITWAAFSAVGPHICGVEEKRSLVVCSKIESTTKADALKAIEKNPNLPALTDALARMQEGLGIKELNDAIKGLKVGDKYKGFKDGTALAELEAWRKSRGWFKTEETNLMYEGHDATTLMNLSQSGDIRATQFLASKTKLPAKKQRLYQFAAAHGSTAALIYLASAIQFDSPLKDKKGNDKKPWIMDILTYYEVARLRGDPQGDVVGKQSIFISNMDVELTPEENNAVQVAAKSLYDKLQQQRFQLGLGKFDNTVPESVKTYYEMRKNDIEG